MRHPIARIPKAGVMSLALSGCATGYTVFEENNRNLIYSGTRRDLEEWAFAHGGFIDLPFSFVFDTILLPYTIPRTIWNHATAEEEEADPEGGGAEAEEAG